MAALPAPCSLTLGALYSRQPQAGEDGQLQPIDATTRIKPEEGLELLRLARDLQAGALLEIGLAYGFSTQFLLASLVPRGGGGWWRWIPFRAATGMASAGAWPSGRRLP